MPPLSSSRLIISTLLLSAAAFAACGGPRGPLQGKASDEWTRSYTLQDGGEFQIVGGKGSIVVQGGDGPAIDVTAERIGRSATDEGARPIPARIRITEEVAPDKIVLRNEGLGGVIIGIETEVNFRVTVPRSTRLRLHAANGDVTVSDVTGTVVASVTNGAIVGKRLGGGVEVRSSNGDVNMELAAVSKEPVELRATNGDVALSLPSTADANIDATATNGSIEVTDLPLEKSGEQRARRTRGRLNAGGTPLELTTTNGNIHITGIPAAR